MPRPRPRSHASRRSMHCPDAPNRPQICIVTPDLLGPVRNGGIGTACTSLAFDLASSGHDVHVLFTQSPTEAHRRDGWIRDYRRHGIAVTVADTWARLRHGGSLPRVFPDHRPLLMAHIVYEWLAQRERQKRPFDVVIFMEWQGSGFYALYAKRSTALFQGTSLVVQIHSPSLWHSVNNAAIEKWPAQALTWFMERQSVALADAVVSPSRYMLDWCAESGYAVPDDARVLPNLLDLDFLPPRAAAQAQVRELVFFGRLEYRKGIVQFCDAVDLLIRRGVPLQCVTFMGKFAWVGKEHAAMYIARRARCWSFPVSVLSDLDHRQALGYLAEGGRLAVMPSVADNSPYTVYECLKAGIPLVARDVGGIPELVPENARGNCLCSDNPRSLAEKLEAALTAGGCCPGLSFDEEQNRKEWREWISDLVTQGRERILSPKAIPAQTGPKVTVCLTHYERPAFLRQAVDALLKQDYPNFEVILADDGSRSSQALRCLEELQSVFAARGWKILRLENGFPGRARNLAVRATDAEWLLFFDDDNVARPHMISRFVAGVLRSAADLAVCAFDVFSGTGSPETSEAEERFLPLGGIVSYSSLSNHIGDTTSLVRRSLFERLGGFTEDYGVGHEDFELYLKAVLAGARIAVLPDALFWYRRIPQEGIQRGTDNAANRARSLRPFLSHASPDMAELAIMMHGAIMGDTGMAERIAAAPAVLPESERPAFARRDPNAPESLVAVIRELLASRQGALGRALLTTLIHHRKTLSAPELRTLIEASVLEELESGRHTTLASSIRDFEALTTDDTVRTTFYLTVIERCDATRKALRRELYEKIVRMEDIDIPLRLRAASMMFDDGFGEMGSRVLEQALQQAEEIYLEQRPDVRAAVKRGDFSSALHHYTLHGKEDHTEWPYINEFISLKQVKYQH